MKRSGFTLIELLVVIAIVGILSTLAMVSLNFARNAAKLAKAQHTVDQLVTAIKQLENDTNEWPGHQAVDDITTAGTNEIWDLNQSVAGIVTTDSSFASWNGPYMAEVPLDPWGNAYFWDSDYQIDGANKVVVGSFGPNGVGQNIYDSDDVIKVIR